MHGGSAIVEGVGDTVTRHDCVPDLYAAICLPEARCSTKEVYTLYDVTPSGSFRPDAVIALAGDARAAPRPDALFNDLTRPAIRAAPQLESLVAEFGALAERPAALSGSGAAFFVLCDDRLHAESLARTAEERLGVPSIAVRAVAYEHQPPTMEAKR